MPHAGEHTIAITEQPAEDDDAVHHDALFQPGAEGHLDADGIASGLSSLLGRYPSAPVTVLKSDGICVPAPEGLELGSHPLLEARSGLDLVVHADRLRLLASWDDVLSRGAARCVTHLASEPGRPVTFYGFDLRERHEVIVVVYVPADGAEDERPVVPASAAERSLPRFATIGKDERSFIIAIDDALSQILGWSAEELIGRRSIEFIHPDDHPLAIDNWMEMLASPGPGRRVRLRHQHKDGSWVWFEVTNHNLLDQPERHAVVSEMVDISEEMAAQEELRARKELLDRIAEAMPVGLLHLAASGEVLYTNDRLHEILGVPRAATVAEQLASLLSEDRERLTGALAEVLAGGSTGDLEVHVRAGEGAGKRRLCAISVRPLSDGHGAITGAIACVTDNTEGVLMREELRRRATFDELTGCYNRASITHLLERTVGEDPECACAVLFADLDRFKQVNDRLGHAAGDELLRVLAERLRGAVRAGDHVGRLGGDEFLVVCPQVEARERAVALARRVERMLGEPVLLGGETLMPRVSVGVAWSRCGATSAEALVAAADGEMYAVKHAGRSGAAAHGGADAA